MAFLQDSPGNLPGIVGDAVGVDVQAWHIVSNQVFCLNDGPLRSNLPGFLIGLAFTGSDLDHRFINLYTDHGGTLDESQGMLNQIRDLKLSAKSVDEADLTPVIVMPTILLQIWMTRLSFILCWPTNWLYYIIY